MRLRNLLLITFFGALALPGARAQLAPPACNPATDPYAARRAQIAQALAGVNEANRGALAASNDPDKMVLLGNYFAKEGQNSEAQNWWNEAAQRGDALGYAALGDHAGDDLAAKRKFYAQAAQLGDPDAEQVYGAMLLRGEGGPAAHLLGREFVLKAAQEGSLDGLVTAGAASTGIATHPFTDFFSKNAALADCFLKAAQNRGSVEARRTLREAYDAGVLTDPVPTPLLSQTSAFLDYLRSFAPEDRAAVLQKALDKDRGSANTTRALEEIAWLTPAPAPGAPVSPTVDILRAQSPNNATALYFSLRSALPSLPANPYTGQPMLHDAASFDLGTRLHQAAVAGLAALDAASLTLGLDPDNMQPRRLAAAKVFEQAAALDAAVAAGARWLHPKTADDVVDDYLEQRGGLAALTALNAVHVALGVAVTVKDKDPKSWEREVFAGRAEVFPWQPVSGSDDGFVTPALRPHTYEFVASDGHGWYAKNDNGPISWGPEIAPVKRGKGVPPDFGALHAPAAGDLDGPLVEYARLRPQHPASPTLVLAPGLQQINGTAVYHLSFAYDRDTTPDYDAFIDAKTYQLVRLAWQWTADKSSVQVDYSGYQRPKDSPLLLPYTCTLTLAKDDNHDNDITEVDTLLAVELNPKSLDPKLFSLTKDDAKKIKDDLDRRASDDKKN